MKVFSKSILATIIIAACQQSYAANPQAMNDVFVVPMNSTTDIPFSTLLANDTDEDGDTLTVLIADDTTNGNSVTNHSEQIIQFTPTHNFVGIAQFTYTLSDGTDQGNYDLMDWGNVQLLVENTLLENGNHRPLANVDYVTVAVNQALTLPVSQLIENDFDADNDELEVITVDDVENGTLSYQQSTGLITFTPEANFTGLAKFNYALSDGKDGGDWDLIAFSRVDIAVGGATSNDNSLCEITESNAAPLANSDYFTSGQNQSVVITFEQLLANDTDVDGDQLYVMLADDVSNGTFVLDSDSQQIIFTATQNFVGEAEFSYAISDGHDCGDVDKLVWSTVTINVTTSTSGGGDDISPPIESWAYTPSNLLLECARPNAANIEWLDTGPENSKADNFVIYLNDQFIGETTSTSLMLNDLAADTEYQVTIAAQLNDSPLSEKSVALNISTPSAYVPTTAINYFVFGHSLFTYDGGDVAEPSLHTRAGNWLAMLAQASGTAMTGGGIFGQIAEHIDVLPIAQAGFAYQCNSDVYWDSDMDGTVWADQSFDQVIIMPSNYHEPSLPVEQSIPQTVTLTDHVEITQPNADIFLYQHWPDTPFPQVGIDTTPLNEITAAQFTAYNQYTVGSYHTWYVDYQNAINAARPTQNVRMIPAGAVIADLLLNEPYLAGLTFSDLYGDHSPHGTENIYLLAALVTYHVMVNDTPNLDNFAIPEGAKQIIPEIRNNLPAIVSYIEQRLAYYNENGVNVY